MLPRNPDGPNVPLCQGFALLIEGTTETVTIGVYLADDDIRQKGQIVSNHSPIQRHRSLFLSDLHLGSMACRADLVLRFLQQNQAEHYVLVGDILDIWGPIPAHWSAAAQQVIDHLHARHGDGARVSYIIGNHDPRPATAPLARQAPVPAVQEIEHSAADGRRYLVLHGDCLIAVCGGLTTGCRGCRGKQGQNGAARLNGCCLASMRRCIRPAAMNGGWLIWHGGADLMG
jgi:hypothetical protein